MIPLSEKISYPTNFPAETLISLVKKLSPSFSYQVVFMKCHFFQSDCRSIVAVTKPIAFLAIQKFNPPVKGILVPVLWLPYLGACTRVRYGPPPLGRGTNYQSLSAALRSDYAKPRLLPTLPLHLISPAFGLGNKLPYRFLPDRIGFQ